MRRNELARLALVAAAAALTFRLGIGLTIELGDEGQILYPSWLTARGAVPYRDFHQLYGPSLFALNGALLHWFDASLWAVRLALVATKTVVVVLTYAAARRVAGPTLSLAVAALATAVWALPIWLFNAPYANHYATAWLLAALLLVPPLKKGGEGGFPDRSSPSHDGRAPSRIQKIPPGPPFSKGGILAGLCLGVAATFKQTTGVLLLIGLGVALLAALRSPSPTRAQPLARLICGAFLFGAAAVVVGYLGSGSPLNSVVLAAPLLGLFAVVVWDWRRLDRDGAAGTLLGLGAGAAVPLLLCALSLAALGGFGAMVRDTLTELPVAVRWFTPLRVPGGNAGWLLLAVGAALLLSGPSAAPRWRHAAAVGATAVGIALVGRALWAGYGQAQATFLVAFLPYATALAGVALVIRRRADAVALAPATGFAAASLLLLFPSADVWHALMGLPLALPLLAGLLERWSIGRHARQAAVVAAVLVLVAPFAAQSWRARDTPWPEAGSPRAPNIHIADRALIDLPALLAALNGYAPERPLFVAANQQLLYVLSGRDSPLARDEYLLYLTYLGTIDPAAAQRLLREDDAVARLSAARPIVVTYPSRDDDRLRATFPGIGRWVDEQTRPVARFGRYELREPLP
jgi:hypothetical protein